MIELKKLREKLDEFEAQLLDDSDKATEQIKSIDARRAQIEIETERLELQRAYQIGVRDYTLGLATVRFKARQAKEAPTEDQQPNIIDS